MSRRSPLEEQLARVPLFAGLDDAQLQHVARLMFQAREPADVVLTKEGERGHEFAIVLDGEVEVRQAGRVLGTLGAGDYIGEIALLDERARRTATIITTQAVRVAFLGRTEFNALLAEMTELSELIRATMTERLAAHDAVRGE
jgi:CRP/FNR family transcriptional regulator, cyclic AMP receptor protein